MVARPVLVTGFGPFPGMPRNPSEAIVRRIGAEDLPGVAARILPTEWAVCDWLGERAGAAETVVMFGVAGGARRLRYERVSRPRARDAPDAAAMLPVRPPARSRRTALDVPALVAAARRAGFPATVSDDAGAYICNASYGAVLAAVPRALFVHVPPAQPSGILSLDGLEAHALWLIRRLGARDGDVRGAPRRGGWRPPHGRAFRWHPINPTDRNSRRP